MDRPLWQIVLTLLVAGTGVQRGGVAVLALLAEGPSPVPLALALEAAAFLFAALGLWIGGRAALRGALALGVCLVAGAVAIAVAGGVQAVPNAIGRAFFGVAASAGLAFIVRTELLSHTKGTAE